MTRRQLTILGLMVAVVASNSFAVSGSSADKTTVCHLAGKSGKGVTITVANQAIPTHLSHGDALGACDASPSR